MTVPGFSFKVSGEEAVVKRFRGMGERAVDARPLWDVLEARFVRMEARQFSSQGHGTWAPLSPDYSAWKAEHFPGKPILQQTGRLFHSLVDELAIAVKEPHMAVFGTDVPEGALHQSGTSRMPARKVIDFADVEAQMWVDAARDWIFEGSLGAGQVAA